MNTLQLSKELFLRGERIHTINGYYGLLMMFAFTQTAKVSEDEQLIRMAIDRLKAYPESYGPSHCNFVNYRIGGLAKGWAIIEGMIDDENDTIRDYAEKTIASPKDRNGILCMPSHPEKEQVWIDTVYAVTPFMLYTGVILNEDKYIDFAFEQCEKLYTLLLDKNNGLLHQSKGFMEDNNAISEDHWSRGNGWCYLGLTELVKYLPADSPHRPKAEQYFRDLSEALLPHQTSKGLWRQEIPCQYAWIESSGTALFTYGLGTGIRLGLLDRSKFEKPFKDAVAGLARYCIGADLSTKMSCEGCLCPGEGASKGTVVAYLTDAFPCQDEEHSFGAFILAMIEAYRNGITEVTLRRR